MVHLLHDLDLSLKLGDFLHELLFGELELLDCHLLSLSGVDGERDYPEAPLTDIFDKAIPAIKQTH